MGKRSRRLLLRWHGRGPRVSAWRAVTESPTRLALLPGNTACLRAPEPPWPCAAGGLGMQFPFEEMMT